MSNQKDRKNDPSRKSIPDTGNYPAKRAEKRPTKDDRTGDRQQSDEKAAKSAGHSQDNAKASKKDQRTK